MAAFDHGIKIITHEAGRHLAEVAGEHCTSWEPIVSEVQTVERLADRAFRAARGDERFVVYFEAYTYWDASAPRSALCKSGLLSERERLPTVCILFILHPRGYQSLKGRFRLRVGARTTQLLAVREVCLWKKTPQPWWDAVPGLMPLYPLCRHGRRPPDAVTHAAEVIEANERDVVKRGNLLTLLEVFGTLAYPDLDVVALIGSQSMRESPGYQRIMREGAVETARAYILDLLESRFGRRPAQSVADIVNTIEDLGRLEALHRRPALCAGLDEFLEDLASEEGGGTPTRQRRRRGRREAGG